MIKRSRWLVFLVCCWNACPGVADQAAQAPIVRHESIFHPVYNTSGMVVSQHKLATKVGAQILEDGGNAVDAAVAVGFALAVVLPRAGNLGGGGFMLVHMKKDDETIALDYRETAPKSATETMYLDGSGEVDRSKALFSYQSSGVPGTVAGLIKAQDKYGVLPLKDVIAPAYKLATAGFPVTYDLSVVLSQASHLQKDPESRKVFFHEDGRPLQPGEILRQPDLAWSLQQIMRKGADAFYEGKIAEKIVDAMAQNEGLIGAEDLQNYQAIERQPVQGTYRGYEIVSMPPPSSGGVHIVQMLNILEYFPLDKMGFGSADAIHIMTEAMRRAYADRSVYLGDPDFVDVPVARLTDKAYAKALAEGIDDSKATPSSAVKPGSELPGEGPNTTHFSVADSDGNVVSNTYTLNFSFGSGIMIPGTGILMNNEMDDFSAKPGAPNAYGLIGGDANKIEPGKRPLSSMTPTLVFRDDEPYLVTGSPGGSRIITTVLQSIVNNLDFGMNIDAAVSMPRFHHQWQPDVLFMEKGFSPDTKERLKSMGHQVETVSSMGSANSIAIDQGVFQGAADPRKPDARAAGPAQY